MKRILGVAVAFIAMWTAGSSLRGRSQDLGSAQPLTAPQLFKERGCEHCHMLHGAGGRKGPDLTNVGKRLSAEAITRQIREGGGAMPAYADALEAAEIQRLTQLLSHSQQGR